MDYWPRMLCGELECWVGPPSMGRTLLILLTTILEYIYLFIYSLTLIVN
jgi:hypothetical protein